MFKIKIKYLAFFILALAFIAIFLLGSQSPKEDDPVGLDTAVSGKAGMYQVLSGDSISEIYFYGSVRDEAKKIADNGLFMPVDSFNWSYALVRFKNKVNLLDHYVVLSAKGVYGNEVLKIGATDVNRHTTPPDKLYEINLTTDWQEIIVKAEDIRTLFVNKSCIIDLKFITDVASQTPRNKGMVYIRNISLVKPDMEQAAAR